VKRPPISACIITFNEEENICDCLESIKWIKEIIVVDSFSKDRTVAICHEYTDKVFQKAWQGHVKQKNCALDYASNEWVLCLDADERVSPELKEEIEHRLLEDAHSFDGYFFPRHSYYLGRWINHGGWYPDYKLRLFRKSKGRWGGKDPHDKIVLNGSTTYLKGKLLHYVYKDLSHQLQTVDNFSTITAKILEQEGEKFSLLKLLFRPPFRFLEMYVIKKGFRDGLPGFIIAVSSSFYIFLKYAKLWEMKKHKSKNSANRRDRGERRDF
jgi:glycosyltransferase involved in cell wall biosynthesis